MTYSKFLITLIMAFVAVVHSGRTGAASRDLEILGWVENARLLSPGIAIKAKLDTGAETSSLDAEIIKKFRKGGKRWIRFKIVDRESGEEYIIVRQRVRTVGIIQHDGSSHSRPVVKMKICIAGRILKTELSLVDRGEFVYQLLLGRSALESFALVDPDNTFLTEPDCAPKSVQADSK